MNRRTFICLPVVLAAASAFAQETRVRRVGLLMTASAAVYPQIHDALVQGLRKEGYVDGQNVRISL
jgi:hypothetical protein